MSICVFMFGVTSMECYQGWASNFFEKKLVVFFSPHFKVYLYYFMFLVFFFCIGVYLL